MAPRPSLKGLRHAAALAVGVAGLALTAQPSWAQADKPAKPASGSGAAHQGEVDSVVVHAPRHHPKPGIPPDRAKAFADDAARDEAWRQYRDSYPPPGAGTLDQSKDYPGLHDYVQP